jgi:hypothetical protein
MTASCRLREKLDMLFEERLRRSLAIVTLGILLISMFVPLLANQSLVEASPTDWHKYEGNPTLNGLQNGFASVFYDSSLGVYHLFCSWSSILHFTSANGITGWTADPENPMLSGNGEGVPMVWKEGDTWYMLYRYGGPDMIGLANSTDATHWTRYEGNPVLYEGGSFMDPWGVIKVGSTYYLWYNDGWGGGYGGRCAGLATSTDLKSWTKDPNNPIFTGGRYCVFPFKYEGYYYMLVPHYTYSDYGEIELYRDVNPTFYPSSRVSLGVVVNPGPQGAWDDRRFDTPCVLTDTIYRDTYAAAGNQLWTYYAATGTPTGSGSDWWTGMCIEQNIIDALTRVGASLPFPELIDETIVLDYNSSCWDGTRGGPHNLDVVELNKDGHRYWGYYGTVDHNSVGLAFSDDLEHWTRYSTTAPLIDGFGWPTVGVQNDTIYMFYIKGGILDKIYWATSPATDGYTFTEQGFAVSDSTSHDPFLWHNPVDGDWWLLWKENINVGTIKCCHARNIADLPSSPHMILRTETNGYYGTLAAPGIFYSNGIYYLTDESCPSLWQTRTFYSSVLAEGCFNGACECSNSPILSDSDACGFPLVEGNKLYYYWSHGLGSGWNLKLREANLVSAPPTKLYISPDSMNKRPEDVGTTFDVDLTIENVTDLFGFDFNLTWDRNVIGLVGVDCESLLDAIWGSGGWFLVKNETAQGWYKLVALSTSSGFNSSGVQALLKLTFLVETTYGQDAQTAIHFGVAKLSDSSGQPIAAGITDGNYRMIGVTPTIRMSPASMLCRKYSENFTVTVSVADVYNATDFQFEIHYNATLLECVNVTFVSWPSGAVILDGVGGNLTGYTEGDPISGNTTILRMTFRASYYHIWKKIAGWTNDLSSTMYFQWVNLSYPSGPDLGYVRGGLNQINVGADVNYTFSPIQGDVNNDGVVDIFDIRTVAAYYDVKESDPLWMEASKYDLTRPTGENVIDVYDIVVIALNYGFTYG